jgi:hypothetical protein
MRPKGRLVGVAWLLLSACSPAEAPVAAIHTNASLCDIRSGQSPPQAGAAIAQCEDGVAFIVDEVIVEPTDSHAYNVHLRVSPQSRPALQAWLARQKRRGVVLIVRDRALLNLMVTSRSAEQLVLPAGTLDEANALKRAFGG